MNYDEVVISSRVFTLAIDMILLPQVGLCFDKVHLGVGSVIVIFQTRPLCVEVFHVMASVSDYNVRDVDKLILGDDIARQYSKVKRLVEPCLNFIK